MESGAPKPFFMTFLQQVQCRLLLARAVSSLLLRPPFLAVQDQAMVEDPLHLQALGIDQRRLRVLLQANWRPLLNTVGLGMLYLKVTLPIIYNFNLSLCQVFQPE